MLGHVPRTCSSRSQAAILDISSSLLPLESRLSRSLTYTSSLFLINLSAATWIFSLLIWPPFQSAFPVAARVIFSKGISKKTFPVFLIMKANFSSWRGFHRCPQQRWQPCCFLLGVISCCRAFACAAGSVGTPFPLCPVNTYLQSSA